MKLPLWIGVALVGVLLASNCLAIQISDGQGNVICYTADSWVCPECNDLYKINGKTGAVIWKISPVNSPMHFLFVDKKNDLIMAGRLDFSSLAKISGSNGQTIWEADVSSIFILDVQLDKNGAPIVDGYDLEDGYHYLTKFDGVTGNKVWSRKVD